MTATLPARGGLVSRVGHMWERARTVSRSWSSWLPVQGPYTSVVVSDSDVLWNWPLSQRAALAVAAVYRSIAIYCDDIGSLPAQRFRGFEQLGDPPFVARPAGEVVGWTDEIGQVIWSLLLRGNAYVLPTSYDWTGYPSTFSVVSPDAMGVDIDDGLPRYRWRGAGGRDVEVVAPRATELLHIRWQRPPGSFMGVGVLDVNAGPGSTLAGAVATEAYNADLMANPTPPAVLTHPLRLNKQQAVDLQSQWQESVARARAVPAVLSGGITYQPLTVSASDVQLIESRRYNATAVATFFGVPPYMVGGSTGDSMTYSTVEGEMTRLWVQTLQPMAVRLQRAFSAWLPAGQRLRFNPDALLRSQTLDRFNAHKIALDSRFETVDEVRALENLAPLPVPAPQDDTLGEPAPLELIPPVLEEVI